MVKQKTILVAMVAAALSALLCAGCSFGQDAGQVDNAPGSATAPAQEANESEAPADSPAEEMNLPASVVAGYPAPAFTCPVLGPDGLTGESVSLSDFQGKVVVITAWASWCGYCVEDMPTWDLLADEFGDDVVVIAVNVGDDEATAAQFVSEHDYDFVWCGTSYEFNDGYPSQGIPYDIIVDRNGVAQWTLEGSLTDRMYDTYSQILGELTA